MKTSITLIASALAALTSAQDTYTTYTTLPAHTSTHTATAVVTSPIYVNYTSTVTAGDAPSPVTILPIDATDAPVMSVHSSTMTKTMVHDGTTSIKTSVVSSTITVKGHSSASASASATADAVSTTHPHAASSGSPAGAAPVAATSGKASAAVSTSVQAPASPVAAVSSAPSASVAPYVPGANGAGALKVGAGAGLVVAVMIGALFV